MIQKLKVLYLRYLYSIYMTAAYLSQMQGEYEAMASWQSSAEEIQRRLDVETVNRRFAQ